MHNIDDSGEFQDAPRMIEEGRSKKETVCATVISVFVIRGFLKSDTVFSYSVFNITVLEEPYSYGRTFH